MLRSRIIPALLIKENRLVKTVNFKNGVYLGDPMNAVRIFNEKEADELLVCDIDATRLNKEPNYELISNLAKQCRMPLCYSGGIKNLISAEKIIGLGVEKIAIGSAAIKNLELIREISQKLGSQSVVLVCDINKQGIRQNYKVFINNGTYNTNLDPCDTVLSAQNSGAGEILINFINNDGLMSGYDIDMINKIKNTINIPLTVLGGAGSILDLKKLIKLHDPIGVAAGSLFVFKGKLKAVLINYPDRETKIEICKGI